MFPEDVNGVSEQEIGAIEQAVEGLENALDQVGSAEIEGTTNAYDIGATGQKRRIMVKQTSANYTLQTARGQIAQIKAALKSAAKKAASKALDAWAATSGIKVVQLRFQAPGAAGPYSITLGSTNLPGMFSALVVFSPNPCDITGIQVGGLPVSNPDSAVTLSANTQGVEIAMGDRGLSSGQGVSATVVTTAPNQVIMFSILRKPTPMCGSTGIRYFNT